MNAKAKILVIEDEPDVLTMIKLVLMRAGFEVTVALSGFEGVRLAESGEFDLITTDIDLPEMNGFEICSRIKNTFQTRHTPIIFVSGRFFEEDIQQSQSLGAADFITKPFDSTSFVRRIHLILNQHKRQNVSKI